MKTTSSTLLALFFGFAIVNLFAVSSGSEVLNFATKPLLVSFLAVWFFLQTRGNLTPSSRFFLVGLIFSVAGDTLLMFVNARGELFFLLGLGSFLFAHLSYITSFSKFPALKSGAIWRNKWLILLFLIVLVIVICLLWDKLGAFLIPVVVYAAVIVSMSAFCFNMKNRVPNNIFYMLFGGAILFVVSDLIIAMKKFKYPEANEVTIGLIIMATYLIGQYLLTIGMVKANSCERERIT
ncbi:MAG: lysoplasmalogenase [Saprospiraceae bacterium]|nr:lysoplasmalogenase [Saprospiraceae bacterium]MCF8252819.1 lysoplasmalogenase [Saprospiraceae bacterium]MCF8283265.1 lysoplasmalogenase [Bacteroidales bacterium]MCF8314374.1 lysoplasmalogenase [Saprospiraceae bacterium]MCF8443257.1 lysoplasmalogenase [Saprospiraceae bacterium]